MIRLRLAFFLLALERIPLALADRCFKKDMLTTTNRLVFFSRRIRLWAEALIDSVDRNNKKEKQKLGIK